MKLGLKPPDPRKPILLELGRYVDLAKLPVPPDQFGHQGLVKDPAWTDALGNDDWGDCACAGPGHQIIEWHAETGIPVNITEASTLQNYTQIAGFNPDAGPSGSNPTDTGCDLDDMANYWRTTGFIDADNNRHQVMAYISLEPGNLVQLWVATFLFSSVGIGWALPNSAMEQTQAGQPWDVVSDDGGEAGGHYTPNFARLNPTEGGVNSWGMWQPFTSRFYSKYNNQGIAALSTEKFKTLQAADIDGLNLTLLEGDLKAVTA
jgi:hypothetical protein